MAKKSPEKKETMVGSMMGQYRLEQMLASGGMARIYRATDTNLERTVAVKVLMRELMDMDDSLTERFEREAKAVAALEHDNIIRIYDYQRHEDLYYIVMNYVEGIDLADELNRLRRENKFMDVDRAMFIMGQVASALDFAHAAGIIHRDIKPSNILLDKHDKAVLTDFGLVLRQSIDKTLGTAFGTPRYISPEQALASEKSVPQSDVYSLAVVVYEILTNDMLFKADTPMQIALSHISEPPPHPRSINPNIPEGVEREILKALEKEPLQRHRSATEFVSALKSAYAATRPEHQQTTRPPSDVRTPIFAEAKDMKGGIQQALKSGTTPLVNLIRPGNKRKTDEWASVEAPASDAQKAAELGKQWDDKAPASRRQHLPMMLVGAIVLVGLIGIIASGVFGGGFNNLFPASTEETGTEESPTAADGTPSVVLATGPLQLQYNGTALVIRNSGTTDVNVKTLMLAKPGAETGFVGTSVRQGTIPAGDCISVVQAGREFDARDWDCLGKDHDLDEITGQLLFWRTTRPDRFEVRLDDQVIATCDTIRRDGTGTCEVKLPSS